MAAPLEISGGEPQGSPTIKIMQELIHIKWTQDFSCIYWLFSGCIWIGTEAEQWLLHQYERLQVLPKATVVVCGCLQMSEPEKVLKTIKHISTLMN